jgi:hypothetical protein
MQQGRRESAALSQSDLKTTGGAMAQATSNIRYDDFIAQIVPDPAKVEPTMLLSGFVGRGEGEATVRIYPEPSLSKWYDVPEADIVHSVPIPDSPLGGSHIWVQRSTQIKPGAVAAAASAAGTDTGTGKPPADPEPTPPSIICATEIFCPTQILCPTDVFCGGRQQGLGAPAQTLTMLITRCICAAPAAAQAGQLRHTLPLCTQGAPTFCACTPGLDCMMGAAQAAFQPTPSAVTLCCFKR